MVNIPLDATERTPFTPESLRSFKPAPAFTLKPVTRRERRAYQQTLVARFPQFETAAFRTQMFEAVRARCDAADAEHNIAMLKEWWQAQDDWAEDQAKWAKERDQWLDEAPEGEERKAEDFPRFADFEHPLHERMSVFADQLRSEWPPLQEMALLNLRHNEMRPRLLLTYALTEWSGISFSAERDRDGRITVASVDALEDAIADLIDEETAARAIAELGIEVMIRTFLPRSAEKNSVSLRLSTPTERLTPETGESPTGTSPASPTSDETPAISSAPTPGN